MKVCMLAYTFYENDNRVMRYAESLVQRGDEVDVIALKKEGKDCFDTIEGVRVYRIQERQLNEKGQLSYLMRILKFLINSAYFISKRQLNIRYDVVHVHSVPDFEVFAAIVPKLFGAKIILDIHDLVPEFYANKFKTGRNSLLYNLLILAEKLSIGFSDHVIISNHIWEKVLLKRSAKSEKCSVILNYPDASMFYNRRESRKNNKFIMMYPGTLNRHQGLDIAIEAIAIIRDKIPDVQLQIYGEGPSKNFLRNLIVKLGLQNNVILNDFVPIKEIPEIMGKADLGIIPKQNDSFGGEAFSTKTLEFMALGVPIIVSRTKIDSYYFDDSIVKFFEPGNEKDLADAMLEMINNKTLRERLAKNASEFVKKYSWEANKHIYLDVVDSLVGKDRGGKVSQIV